MRRIAITDIHGCNETFQELLSQIGLEKSDQLFLLGDYIDRGPDSKGVIDTIWNLQSEGYQVTCLKGNHEQMFLDYYKDPHSTYGRIWLKYGGREMMESFGEYTVGNIGKSYWEFMHGLKHYHLLDDHILVHAGLNFSKPGDPLDRKTEMLWERYWYHYIDYDWLGNRKIIHGHTPTTKADISSQLEQIEYIKALDIDAGCVFNKGGMHHLCAYDLDKKQLYFQKNIERA